MNRLRRPGIGAALLAAGLFGASTPLAKILLGSLPPMLLAGLLYLGSGAGLSIAYLLRNRTSTDAPLTRRDLPWLGGAVFFGGALGPALLMVGLRLTPASTASLLLNLEGVLTALLAWFIFRENFDRRVVVERHVVHAVDAVVGQVLTGQVAEGGHRHRRAPGGRRRGQQHSTDQQSGGGSFNLQLSLSGKNCWTSLSGFF